MESHPPRCQRHQRRPFHGHEHDAEQQHADQTATGGRGVGLLGAAGHFSQSSIPMEPEQTVGAGQAAAGPGLLEHHAQAHVVAHFHPQPVESGGVIEHFAADEIEGPDADEGVGFRIGDGPRPHGHHERAAKQRQNGVDRQRARPEIGHGGHVVKGVIHGVGDRAAERAGSHVDVGIGKQQPGTAGLRRAQGQGMHLAQPAFGELFDVNREDPRIGCGHAIDDGRRAVGGTIVDEDDFQVGVVLLQDRCKADSSAAASLQAGMTIESLGQVGGGGASDRASNGTVRTTRTVPTNIQSQ